jgi:epidermal growth factor receptor substrate 15
LADTQNRGALDSTDFTIGMYFIRGVMDKKIPFIPTSLPAGLYHQAGGGQELFGPAESHISGNSGSFSPIVSSSQHRYHTGQNHFSQPDINRKRLSTQVSNIQNTPREIIGDESDLIALRVEKAEIEGAFLRDKDETRELHERMIETGEQVEALKADVERLKKEAMRQKGLLAIARVQLSTKEREKAKAEREHAEAVEELSSITREMDTVNAELAIMTSSESEHKVAHHTFSSDPLAFQPMTPADLSLNSINPFERLAMSLQRSPLIQDSALSSTEPTTLPPSTTNEVSLELPGSDLLLASSTFNSFSAYQTTASPKFSQPSDELHLQSVLSPAFMTPSGPSTSAEHDSDASLSHPKERVLRLGKLPDSHNKLKKPRSTSNFKLAVRPA